jgi:hypothetical protein
VSNRAGLPITAEIAGASLHEISLVGETVKSSFLPNSPNCLIDDSRYDTDSLDDGPRIGHGSRSTRTLAMQIRALESTPFVPLRDSGGSGQPMRRAIRPKLFLIPRAAPRCWKSVSCVL